jgi:molybdate transport system substrate-binding protein
LRNAVIPEFGFMTKLAALFTALLILLPPRLQADELRVAVASNFTPVLQRLAPVFKQESGHTLTLISGATGQHYTQIVNGAPFDVFLAADAERPALLETNGRGIAGTRSTYAIGMLVLWSMDAGLVDDTAAVLRGSAFRHLAMANPKLAPYGNAAREVLMGLGLWENLQERLVQGENITQTLQFVQSGNAELGFIARAQWLEIDPLRKGSYWQVPADLHSPLDQQAIVLRDSVAARAFLAFLQSDASREVIHAAGYGLP